MKIALLVLVVSGALLVIASGVWVAFALISAISWHRTEPTAPIRHSFAAASTPTVTTNKDSARPCSGRLRPEEQESKSGD